jgi:hypothetical protein
MHSRTAWDDYFTGSPTPMQTKEYGTRQTPSDTGIYVSNCLFRSIESGSDGGALYCTSTYLLVESTSFFSCKTSSRFGGAIYFSNSNDGQCVLCEVCGYDCCSTYTGTPHYQFAYINVNNVATSKNYVNYSSIARCVSVSSGSYHVLRFYYGKIYCPSVNSSMHKCQYYSAISCSPFGDSNSVTCSFLYSTFTDNIAYGYGCIVLWTTGTKYEIKSCNILRNTHRSLDTYGIIYTSGNLDIKDSCILENNATPIFQASSSSYTITLSNCTVDSTSNNGYLTTQNTVTKSFILALNHMSTQNCHSEYDSAGYLTPIIQTPSPSKKQIHCYTFGNFLYQYKLRYLISLISVFLFSFIHLDVSIYPLY